MNFPFHYEFGEEGLEVRLGPWTVRRVRYDDIEDIRIGYNLWNEHWTNIWPWRYLTLRRKTGWVRNFVINPADREAFAQLLRQRLGA
ncbi:MAG: PH domain-containing protein [Elusimicrobia bacterium]|nr:PH domain-containing protein [Elusimicrobiota bacterium]MDE2236334.1 PH domain-containing protein [Elusimicrobiota bacterium]MDE2426489.1 PH domain-containing protein [Elusimicrobiota bacterium]